MLIYKLAWGVKFFGGKLLSFSTAPKIQSLVLLSQKFSDRRYLLNLGFDRDLLEMRPRKYRRYLGLVSTTSVPERVETRENDTCTY